MFFFPGKIAPFIGIGPHVIELFATTCVPDVAPSVIAQPEAPRLREMGQRDVRPVGVRVRKQRYEARAIVPGLSRQPAELQQGRRQAQQTDRSIANGGLCTAGETARR